MGFIDYHGTKEDRYDEVLDYARMQQEEEIKRLQDAKIEKWLKEILGESKYSNLTINETIKYVMVKYRSLCDIKNEMLTKYTEGIPINPDILWNDFSSYIISRHLEPFHFDTEKQMNYYTTFSSKVFKVEQYTSAETHYQAMANNSDYRTYLGACFDVAQEKQFWKWIGRIGNKDKKRLAEFVSIYEQLTVLMGYYLFQGVRPNSDEWMRRLEIEKQVLEKIRDDYNKNRLKEPNYDKMHNPLFEPPKDRKTVVTSARQEPFHVEPEPKPVVEVPPEPEIEEPVRKRRPQLDKVRFTQLLEKQELMSYVEACRLLRKCVLPEHIDSLYKELILRIPVLQESIDKYKDVYQPDMFMFYDYYIPEALQLTSIYIEYLDVGIGEAILQENEREVLVATNKLIIAVNDKVDEIYKYASIQLKAKAKALESIMSQNGHLDPSQKIN